MKSDSSPTRKHSQYGNYIAPIIRLRDFAERFVDYEEFISHTQEWPLEKLANREKQFKEPFHFNQLQQLEYALESINFQQRLRMQSRSENSTIARAEDFVYTVAQTLWRILWSSDDQMPFIVIGPQEKEDHLNGVALVGMKGHTTNSLWEHIVVFVEVQPQIGGETSRIVGRSLFHGLHMLMARLYSKKKPSRRPNLDTVYLLFVDSKYGGVMRLRGDITRLDTKSRWPCKAAVDWIQMHADIAVSFVEEVWNRFGNVNWKDFGSLQLILAMFYSMEHSKGSPKRSLAKLAANHCSKLQIRNIERWILEIEENGIDHQESVHDIQHMDNAVVWEIEAVKLEPGASVWVENANMKREFRITGMLGDEKYPMYTAVSLVDGDNSLAMYVGPHSSQLDTLWDDMTMWYHVTRQTTVLNNMKERGVSSRYLPQVLSSGSILHSRHCTIESLGRSCEHALCGNPILVTSPAGESLDVVVAKTGWLSTLDAVRCCHNLLSALWSANSTGIQHGNIAPNQVIRVQDGDGDFYYVLVGWGHAVLEDKDAPETNQMYSSTYALQEGKLYPAADVESLVYLMYFLAGGSMPEYENMEGVVEWRERAWAQRIFQDLLGEVSMVLKAYADYINSLIGTPYSVDYNTWLSILSRAVYYSNA